MPRKARGCATRPAATPTRVSSSACAACSSGSTIVGRLQREVTRKLSAIGQAVSDALSTTLTKARQIWEQTAGRKTKNGKAKLYSWHASEVQYINKGKSRQPYEFGAKVGIATTLKHNLIVGAKAFSGNPFDGHTLNPQLEQATILMQDSEVEPVTGCTRCYARPASISAGCCA